MTSIFIGPLFSLGELIITRHADALLSEDDIRLAVNRHIIGDWGNIPEGDRGLNNEALRLGERLMSVYESSDGVQFWIITEWDRSVTTILLPSDY